MRIHFSNTIRIILSGVLMFTISCTKDTLLTIPDGGGTTLNDGKVKLELFATIPDYRPPLTRMGSAQEDKVEMTPWVLVFNGTTDAATYVEAAQAIEMAGKRFVTLTAQPAACRLLIIANPQINFTSNNGYSSLTLNKANFDAVLKPGGTPVTLAQASKLLLTEALTTPQQTTVPFASTAATKPVIPMSYLHGVANISETTQIGTSVSLIELQRIVAKVVVNNEAANFTLLGATVVNAPVYGELYRSGATLRDNSAAGMLTNYLASSGDQVTGIAEANTTVAGEQSTEHPTDISKKHPIYLYESRTNENTAVVIKGTYEGVDYYYRLTFLAPDKQTKINILRNQQYTFNITSVERPGFTTLADAMNALHGSNEDITYTITVSDQYAHDIVDNGEYYLGVTNSVYIAYGDGALNNMLAFSVSTDREAVLTDNSITVSGTGLSLAAPLTGKITLATGSTINSTEVRINMTPGFTTGTVTLRLGNMKKTVTIEKRPSIAGALTHFEVPGSNDYIYAEVTAGDSWLSLSDDSWHNQGSVVNIQTTTKKLYLMPTLNYGSGADKNGTVYVSRDDNSNGRIKMDIIQKATPITAPPGITGLPYPYVGTFHRASEMGERLVRIPIATSNNGAWSAKVVDGQDFIKLALDFRNGGVGWPYNDVNAEISANLVDGNAAEIRNTAAANTEVRFRVGMKSKLSNTNPDMTTPPRYGLILVTYGGTTDTKCWLVYVRQGEAADYLIGTTQKWTPYNLRATGNPAGTPTLSSSGSAAFTEYPSQAGYYFQWNSLTALYPTGTLSTWAQWGSNSAYNASLDPCTKIATGSYRTPDATLTPTSTTWGLVPLESTIIGLYADGWFDRRTMTNNSVSSGATIAYNGILFTNGLRSLFMPMAGSRRYVDGSLVGHTTSGGIWSSGRNTSTNPYAMVATDDPLIRWDNLTSRNTSMSTRCVTQY